jgi:hypothetical protein
MGALVMARLLGAISAFGLILVSWSAQALDADGLRQAITDNLRTQLYFIANGQATFDVEVAEAGDAFAVVVKDLRLSDQPRSFLVDLGTWGFKVKDLGGGFFQVSDVASPGAIMLEGAEGSPLKVASFVLERFEGRWSSTLMNFLDADIVMKDIKAGLEPAGALFTIASLTSQAVGRIDAEGRVDQKASGRGVGLRGAMEGAGGFEATEVFVEYNLEGFDSAAAGFFQEFLSETQALQDETLDQESRRKIATELIGKLPSSTVLPGSFGERFTLTGVTVFDHMNQRQGGVDEVEFTFGASGLKTSAAEGKFGTKVTNLAFNPPPELVGAAWLEVVPRNLSFVVAVEQVPVETLWQALFRTMAQDFVAQDDATQDLAMSALGIELMSTLTMAGTRLKLPHLAIDSPSAGLNADGILEADAQAMTGAKGALNVAITGLDNVMALAGSAATPEEQQAMGMLFMLKSTAKRETGADGQPVDVWALELTPDGGILLNGEPFGMPPMQQ